MYKSTKRGLRVSCGAVAVASIVFAMMIVPRAQAKPSMHFDGSGREQPWDNCTLCHGDDLKGDLGPSCMNCHNDFAAPDTPPTGHHVEGRDDPLTNCVLCHGADLTGDFGPSCFTCHDQLWSGGGGGGNSPPNIVAGGPYAGIVDVPVQFDASGTTDPDGDDLTYLWLFGDDSLPSFPSSDPTASHAYEEAGTYTALLTVLDGVNIVAPLQVQVTITESNAPPTASAGGPYAGTAGQAVSMSAAGSSDTDGDALSYAWDFGDGSPVVGPSANAGVDHTFQAAGTYTVIVSVTDGVNDPVTAQATVTVQAASGGGGGGGGGSTTGNGWDLQFPFMGIQGAVEFNDMFGILLVTETIDNGPNLFGIGFRFGGNVVWLDAAGSLFLGAENTSSNTMWGLVFNMVGNSNSVWFAYPQAPPEPALDLGSLGGLLGSLGSGFDLGSLGDLGGSSGSTSGSGTSGSGSSGSSGSSTSGSGSTETSGTGSGGSSAGSGSTTTATPAPVTRPRAYDVYMSRSQ